MGWGSTADQGQKVAIVTAERWHGVGGSFPAMPVHLPRIAQGGSFSSFYHPFIFILLPAKQQLGSLVSCPHTLDQVSRTRDHGLGKGRAGQRS